MANGDPKTYQDGYNDGYRQGLADAGRITTPPITSPGSSPPQIYQCPDCGMLWGGVMGYSCPRSSCPIQPKATC